MSIVSHVKLIATIPMDTAQRVIDTWARTLQAEAPDVYAKILARIPDKKRFVERLAQASHDGFKSFVNPAFVNKSGQPANEIEAAQVSNLKRSYEKYVDKLAFLFETVDGIIAKRFRELVERMKSKFGTGVAERTLPFTGTKIEGRGCAPIAALWLVNDKRVVDYLRAADKVLEGGPYLVTQANQVPSFKAALTGRLTQGGAAIVKGNFDASVITAQNDRINHLVQSLIDPGLGLTPFSTGGISHVDYIMESKQMFLDVQVDRI